MFNLSEKPEGKRFIKRSEVVGKQVVERRGYIIGTVRDLSFALTAEGVELAITVDSGGKEVSIPWEEIQAIGDVILLKTQHERPPTPPPTTATPTPMPTAAPTALPPVGIEKVCPYCGFKNPADAKFCVRCGRRLP
ncbi:zinc-ribbon domain-containing protein [Candidatus Bathyarchaeota archaeon]|nr:MAG: zinc-ribbon domain-containing protein [Candidatus Bathyarchaeota archaeon]